MSAKFASRNERANVRTERARFYDVIDDLKKAKIREATTWAEDLGIREGMSVKKALELMDIVHE